MEIKNLNETAAKVQNFEEKAGYGVCGKYEDKIIYAGTKKFLESFGIEVIQAEEIGTVVYVGVNKQFMGYVILSDEIKDSTKRMVELFKKKS